MKKYTKNSLRAKVELMNQSRPRPTISLRSATFEDKTKYKRSREKQLLRKWC